MGVYDVAGKQIATAVLGSFDPGVHRIAWNPRDAAGRQLTSGMYFLRLQGVAGGNSTQRVVLVR